jgi:ATP-dependent Clp protease protease subunit
MSNTLKALNTLAIWLIAAMLMIFVTLGVLIFFWAVIWSDELPDPSAILESYVDQQIEAGFEFPTLSADDPLLQSRRVLLTTALNERIAHDVVSRLFYLNELDPNEPIDLYLATPGGWSDSAFAIIDTIQLIDAPVNTWALGGCYSSGAMILTSGTGMRYATPNAVIMVHTNLDDSEEPYSGERLFKGRYERLWRATAQLPEEWYPMTSAEAYYLTPPEALEFGIVDAIVEFE